MITKRELSARRDINTIAGVFDTVKCQRDKLLEAMEFYWLMNDALKILDDTYLEGRETAARELNKTVATARKTFKRLSEEIRKEMEGE